MPLAPKTRNSLILRLRNRDDVESWREFISIYEPVIFKVAFRRGFQHADAQELVQRVLVAVSRAVDRFQPDSERAKFRTWLYRITHNEFCKELVNAKKNIASGDSGVQQMLERFPQTAPDDFTDDFTIEYRRAIFRWAAERVRPTVRQTTWNAFWRTSIEGIRTESVAEELGISVGAVYIARSRVMARLQREAANFEEQS